MTEEEAKELKDATWPAEVDGQTRPTDPITVDMPYSEELPQMFSGDFVGPDQPNTAYRQLLSNDKSLKDGTTPVAKATQADTASACTGNSATATKLQTARTISLTGAVTGSASFDGSGDVSIDSTSEVQKISITGDVTGSADFSGSNVSISVSDVLGLINVIQTVGLSHNGIYRGKNLGAISSVSELETFLTAHKVSDGLFTDLYVGDYFTLKDGTYNKEWEIAGFDLYLGKGMDTNKHHLTLIPKRSLLKSVMNSTNTSTGGYYNSYMNQTTIPAVVTNMKKVLGDHMLTKQCLLTDTVDANIASNAGAGLKGAATGTWTWRNVQAVLPSEVEALGYTCASSSWFDVMDACMPLPLFRFKNHREPDGQDWWLRAVATSYGFANVSGTGSLGANHNASSSGGVRPLIWVG